MQDSVNNEMNGMTGYALFLCRGLRCHGFTRQNYVAENDGFAGHPAPAVIGAPE